MTNEITKIEILPPDPTLPLPNDEIIPEKDFAFTDRTVISESPSAHVAANDARVRRGHARRAFRLTVMTALIAVFMIAAYADIFATVSLFTPADAADIAAQLAFGADYAPTDPADSGDPSHAPDTSTTVPNKHIYNIHHIYKPIFFEGDALPEGSLPEDSVPFPTPDTPSGSVFPIVSRDLSSSADRGLECTNQSDYVFDLDYFADAEFPLPPLSELTADNSADRKNPVVLIVHTHGTESYAPEGADTYSTTDNARTTDITQNVVAVGAVMAEYFESRGIETVHCTEMFDNDSYINAYKNSSAAVREYLAIYPSIKYIFDVHRDSIISADYTKYRPVTTVDGTATAQFLCVVGTDTNGAPHPHWRDNLTFAAHLQTRLWNRSNTLTRSMSIRSASFYQQYSPGSLLLEIGSCGNTLSEAKACARLVAEELAEIIISGE